MSLPTAESNASAPAPSARRWFDNEIQPHESMLRSFLHGTFPALRDVDDLVQESYLKTWQAHAAGPIRSPRTFLFQVAKHLALDLLRRKTASPIKSATDAAALFVLDETPNPAEVAISRDEIALLARAIHTLPARCREIVVLRKIKCIPQKEIARQLGISEQTVQVQVFRGLKRIEEHLRRAGVQR